MCRLLDDLIAHLEENGAQDATFIVLDYTFGTFDRIFLGIHKFEEYLERENPTESDMEVADIIQDFKRVITKVFKATHKLGVRMLSGIESKDALKFMKS